MMSNPHSGAIPPARAAHILFLNARDCANPEGGGSEIYVETVARALAAGGNSVTVRSAAFPGCVPREERDGVQIIRAGSKLGVFPRVLRDLRRGELGRPDVIVDVQNGVPFASPLAADSPTVVLVHHVHREQWPVVYDPVRARIGWWVESTLAPRVYRKAPYVAVSEATRAELVGLGIQPERIRVIHNGVQTQLHLQGARSATPRILVLGRLVPHKRVEHVLRAAALLREHVSGLRVSVVGDGWWRNEVEAEAERLAITDIVEVHGFVDDEVKHRELQRAWVLALPSLKEGWGLAITEAASHGVPSVAYRSAGGVAESIRDLESGLLVDGGESDFTSALHRLLTDTALRERLSRGAIERAQSLSWQATAHNFAQVLSDAAKRQIRTGCIESESALRQGEERPAGLERR